MREKEMRKNQKNLESMVMQKSILINCWAKWFLLVVMLMASPALKAAEFHPSHAVKKAVTHSEKSATSQNLELVSFIAGLMAVVGAGATIILALSCFGGCALAVLLIPAILFTIAGLTAVVTGIMALRLRRKEGKPRRRLWMSVVGVAIGAAATIYGIIAMISLNS